MGMPGHVRQGRPGRAGRRRPADPAGDGAHRRRHGGLSVATSTTSSTARPTGIAGQAATGRAGRGLRRARARDTAVRVYEGEVEHFTSAAVRGRRRPGRSPTAAAASPTPAPSTTDAVAEVLAEARDNAAFGTPDECAGLAEPDGVRRRRARPVARRAAGHCPTDDKVALAKELERLTLAADRRIRVDDGRLRRRRWPRAPWPPPPASRTSGRETGVLPVASARWPTTATRPRPASASRSGAQPGRPRPRQGGAATAADRATRAARRHQARQPAGHRRARPVRHRPVPRHPRLDAERRGRAEGPLAVRRPRRRGGGRAAPHAGRRPHQPARLHRHARSTARAWPPGATSLIDGGVLQQFVHRRYSGPPERHGLDRQRRPRRLQVHARRAAAWPCSLVPGTRSQAELIADVDDGVLIQMVQGLHSGVNPVSGDFSTGAEGLLIRGGAAGRAGAGVHHRLHPAADAEGRRRGRRRRRVAADERGRRAASSSATSP